MTQQTPEAYANLLWLFLHWIVCCIHLLLFVLPSEQPMALGNQMVKWEVLPKQGSQRLVSIHTQTNPMAHNASMHPSQHQANKGSHSHHG